MDVSKIENLITDKTSAIMPVHVYGNVCNAEAIQRIAVKVVYDAAHTLGVKYKGKGIGSFGDVSCFSFHATKVFNTIEGSCACFEDEDFANGMTLSEKCTVVVKNITIIFSRLLRCLRHFCHLQNAGKSGRCTGLRLKK